MKSKSHLNFRFENAVEFISEKITNLLSLSQTCKRLNLSLFMHKSKFKPELFKCKNFSQERIGFVIFEDPQVELIDQQRGKFEDAMSIYQYRKKLFEI